MYASTLILEILSAKCFSAAERNTTSIPAVVLLYAFVRACRRLQGTAAVLKGWG
jgi:hypothetical protein